MNTHKHAKEDFVRGLSGGPPAETLAVLAVCVGSYALFLRCASALPATRNASPSSLLFTVLAEFVILLMPALLACSLLADSAATVAASLATALFLLASVIPAPVAVPSPPAAAPKHRPFSVSFRAFLQLLTVLAILAVDFNVFPRRFAKTETFGFSLMDLGVGGIIFSNGFVAGPRLKGKQNPTISDRLENLAKSFAIAFPVLLLGVLRTVMTKSVNYQEHVSEYGVHWNFFFTLGLVPIFTALMQTIAPQLHFGFAGALILGTYEYALQNYGLQDYILTAERHGYWSVFCIAAYLGEKVFGTVEKKGLKTLKRGAAAGSSGRFSLELLNAADLAGFVLPVATMFVLMHSDLGWRVSRRLANAPYCLWVLCVGAAFVAACLCVDWASGSVTYLRAAPDARRRQDAAALRAEKPAVRPPVWQYAQVVPTPYIFECVNRNQLAVFLLVSE
ncbi:Glucosaminyl phosphatidylinositol (GlcN-PI) nositol acylation protein [Entophlyctis luteolus]|nr:Glucosaminyl phosphatidylinositol (GlcN-PI) nositol acylation protein [Entophlyctis luteolus]